MKNELLRKAGKLLGSPAAISLLSNPQFQEALKRAINLRADVRDGWEGQVEGWAKQFNLVTRQDLKGLKRTIRELENHIAAMDYELQQMKAREAAARAAAEAAEEALKQTGHLHSGDEVVILGGTAPIRGAANLMKIDIID